MILDLVISVVTIIQMYLLSRKAKSGLYVGIFSQFLWFAFIITTGSWGLLPLNIALWYIFLTGILKWKDDRTFPGEEVRSPQSFRN
jgi:uncharacterized membrane protein